MADNSIKEELVSSLARHRIPFGKGDELKQIQEELKEGMNALYHMERGVCVFGSARTKRSHPYYQAATKLGKQLGDAGLNVITGGGPGIMEAANRGAKKSSAFSVGICLKLPREAPNQYLDAHVDCEFFFTRKIAYMRRTKGFVIFPGGYGTLDELFEALTLMQNGKMHDFPVVLFGVKYWDGLVRWLKNSMLAEGNIAAEDLKFIVTDSPEEAVSFITSFNQASGIDAKDSNPIL